MKVEQAAKFLESNMNLGMHESVHAVLCRARGADVEITDGTKHALTSCSKKPRSLEWQVMVILGPEVYLSLHGLAFSEKSVSDDRKKVNDLLKGQARVSQFRARMVEKLEVVFSCPYVNQAINVLSDEIAAGIDSLTPVVSDRLRFLVDPILMKSRYARPLRSKLTQQT
jgi:hypothetical protein